MEKEESTFLQPNNRWEGGGEIFFCSFDANIKFLSIKKGRELFCSKDKEGAGFFSLKPGPGTQNFLTDPLELSEEWEVNNDHRSER